jgi:diguanylate cyclase (GGDEF)-like protein
VIAGSTRWKALGAAAAALLLAGFGDRATGEDVPFTLVYLIPVAIASWWIGRTGGLVAALAAAAISMIIAWGRLAPLGPFVQFGNATTDVGIFGLLALLLSRLHASGQIASRLERTDPLTGMKNRRAFVEAAEEELARVRRRPRPFTLALMDVDGFKRLNDTQGRPAGREALMAVAAQILRRLRTVDIVARLGGDEFAVLLPETPGTEAGRALGDLVRLVASECQQRGWQVGLNIGAVTFTSPPESLDVALRDAERQLQEVKRGGDARLWGGA